MKRLKNIPLYSAKILDLNKRRKSNTADDIVGMEDKEKEVLPLPQIEIAINLYIALLY